MQFMGAIGEAPYLKGGVGPTAERFRVLGLHVKVTHHNHLLYMSLSPFTNTTLDLF